MMSEKESNIITAKHITEKWGESIFEAVKNSAPEIRSMSEQDVVFIIGVCAALNIMYKSLYRGKVDTPQWASSVAESSIIMAFLIHYRCDGYVGECSDEYWVSQIENARKGLLGEIPGTNIRIVVNEKIIPRYTRRLNPPERITTKTKTIERYYPNAAKTYLMRDDNSGLYKIGKSVNPKKRWKGFLCSNPAIILCYISDQNVEAELHKKYIDKRIDREWFSLTDEDITEICKNYNFQNINDNGDRS